MNNNLSGFNSTVNKEVLVIGGGPAGVGAAVAAARAGVDTLLIERYQYLGGMVTGSLVGTVFSKWRVHRDVNSKVSLETDYIPEQVIKGIPQEMVDRLIKLGGAYGELGRASSVVSADPETIKYVMDQMIQDSEVSIWLGSIMTNVVMDGNNIQGVIIENKSGRHLVKGRVIIDATGDGDVAAMAGVPYDKGRESDGITMPVSLVFVLGNVDLSKTLKYLKENQDELDQGKVVDAEQCYIEKRPFTLIGFRRLLQKGYENGDLPMAIGAEKPQPLFAIHSIIKEGRIVQNMTAHIVDMAYKIDVTNADQLTQAYIHTRERVRIMLNFFKKYIPGYKECFLMETGPQLGLRESRRIHGEYALTREDILTCKQFEDVIVRCGGSINIHSEVGGDFEQHGGGRIYDAVKYPYHIPYRCLIPLKVDNLLVAGRCISADRSALGSFRGSPVCMAIGQGAGIGAAIAIKTNKKPKEIEIKLLREELLRQGASLGEDERTH